MGGLLELEDHIDYRYFDLFKMSVPYCRKSSLDRLKYIHQLITLISEWADPDPFLWFRCGFYMGLNFYQLDKRFSKNTSLSHKWLSMLQYVYYKKGTENFHAWWLSWVEYTDKKESFFKLLVDNNVENIFLIHRPKLILEPFQFPLVVLTEWLHLVSQSSTYCEKLQLMAENHKEILEEDYNHPFHVMILYALFYELDIMYEIVGDKKSIEKLKNFFFEFSGTHIFSEWTLSRLRLYFLNQNHEHCT